MTTSDALAVQSVERKGRCKYSHKWDEGNGPEISGGHGRFYCLDCGYEPKQDSKLWHEAEAVVHLRKLLKPGDTVYTVLRHVSRSGMSRNIDLYMMDEGQPVWISAYVGHALGTPQSRKNWERSQGLTVGGCGMDMGFHLVYGLSRVLFSDGFVCSGESCPSNDHFNDRTCRRETFKGQMHKGDGGYALNHKWL